MPSSSPSLQPLNLLDDEPTSDAVGDTLELNVFARIIAETAIGTPGPFTIGVFADWGTGKSSVLRQAKTLLDGSDYADGLVTVWFNAWHFEREEHPIVPFVATILQHVARKRDDLLARRASSRTSSVRLAQTWTKITESLQNLAYGFSVKLNIPGVEVGVAKAPEDDNQLKRQTLASAAIEALATCLRVQDDSLSSLTPKIVVFVDDLDRSLPDQAVRLLEGIKLALSQPGFIFVLAVDPRVIEGFLEKRFKEEFNITDYRISGTSYLDKIVQLPLRLPPHDSRFEAYIDRLLSSRIVHDNEHLLAVLRSIRGLLALGCNYNPRTLKRFVNNLLVDRRIRQLQKQGLGSDQSGLSESDFIRLCAVSRSLSLHLEHRWYRLLVDDRELCDAIAAAAERGLRIIECWEMHGQKGAVSDKRMAVLGVLDQHEFLVRLLSSDIGRRWLQDHTGRKAVYEFLEVKSALELPVTQREVIERAMRKTLGKHDSQPVSASDCDSIFELDLSEQPLTDEGVQHLATFSRLATLKLCGTEITDEGARSLGLLKSLRILDIRRTRLTDSGINHLAEVRGLQNLCLRNTRLTDDGLRCIAVLDSLRALDVSFTLVTEVGLQHLPLFTNLEDLDISFLTIQGVGLCHVAKINRLAVLSLYETKLQDDCLSHLVDHPRLRTLILGRTPITDAALCHVAHLSTLRRLDVFDTKITDVGVRNIVGMNGLQRLNLASTLITDGAATSISQLSALEELDVRDTKMSEVGLAKLRAALPNCRIGVG